MPKKACRKKILAGDERNVEELFTRYMKEGYVVDCYRKVREKVRKGDWEIYAVYLSGIISKVRKLGNAYYLTLDNLSTHVSDDKWITECNDEVIIRVHLDENTDAFVTQRLPEMRFLRLYRAYLFISTKGESNKETSGHKQKKEKIPVSLEVFRDKEPVFSYSHFNAHPS